MIAIHRNGLSGLALKVAVIAFAAIMFGCAPRAAGGARGAQPTPVVAAL